MEKNDFEEALDKLQNMTEKIKSTNTSLEDSINCYEEGMKYYNICNDILESAKQKIQVFSKTEE
ncbi:MAG: exodeoxyribonuclease VII small subunit [Anaerovoracaceae bacterium]